MRRRKKINPASETDIKKIRLGRIKKEIFSETMIPKAHINKVMELFINKLAINVSRGKIVCIDSLGSWTPKIRVGKYIPDPTTCGKVMIWQKRKLYPVYKPALAFRKMCEAKTPDKEVTILDL